MPPPARPLALLLILGLGVFFRFSHLGEKLLWHDEIATRVFAAGYTTDDWKGVVYGGEVVTVAQVGHFQIHNAEKSVVGAIGGLARHDPQHPPLYYALTRLWVGLCGDSVGTLRALSALLSLLYLPAIAWLCLEFSGSARVAWMGVALAAVSPFFVLYAQEAREYALWSVLIACATASLLRAIRLTEARAPAALGGWAVYATSIVLALYTSFSSAAFILAHIAYIVIRERGRLTRVSVQSASALAVSALLFSPWAYNLVHHLDSFFATMKWSRDIVIPRPELLWIFGSNLTRVFVDLTAEPLGIVVALALILVAVAIRHVARAPSASGRHPGLLLLLMIAAPITMLLVPDLLSGGIRSVSSRYLTPSWVGIQVALAWMLGAHLSSGATRAVATVLLAAGVVSGALNTRRDAVWTKGISANLPAVAALVNRSEAPLVVGNEERFNPGNLFALVHLLIPSASVQGLKIHAEAGYVLPPHEGDIYLFSPTAPFRERLEEREHVHTQLLFEDIHMQLWKVEREPDITHPG
ncbi:MAG: glycosyltransferase family 39 protein [Pseudomonadota bacterium]|nr:glycosyltransferase family 39 protein [Pseudomonadota bacterium]